MLSTLAFLCAKHCTVCYSIASFGSAGILSCCCLQQAHYFHFSLNCQDRKIWKSFSLFLLRRMWAKRERKWKNLCRFLRPSSSHILNECCLVLLQNAVQVSIVFFSSSLLHYLLLLISIFMLTFALFHVRVRVCVLFGGRDQADMCVCVLLFVPASSNACHCKIYGNFVWCFYWICLKNSIHAFIWTCSRLPVPWLTFLCFCFIQASTFRCFSPSPRLDILCVCVIAKAIRNSDGIQTHKYIDEKRPDLFFHSPVHSLLCALLLALFIFHQFRKFVYIREYCLNATHTHTGSPLRIKYK